MLFLLLQGRPAQAEPKPAQALSRSERLFESHRNPALEALLIPFYIPERVLRHVMLPVARATYLTEEYRLIQRVDDLLSDESGRQRYYPTVGYSSSDGLSFGGSYGFRNLAYRGYDLGAAAALYMNLDFRTGAYFKRAPEVYQPLFYSFNVSGTRNSNASYYGPGFDSSREEKGKYWREEAGTTLKLGYRFPRLRFLETALIARGEYVSTEGARKGESDPDVDEVFKAEEISGFGEDLYLVYYGAEFKYDSRTPKGHAHRGFLLAGRVLRAEDSSGRFTHLRWRVKVGTVIDIYRQSRTLALGLRMEGADLGDVPFFRLPRLDRYTPLRAYPSGRFRDKHTVVANAEYRFPLWKALRPQTTYTLATIFGDVGRPFTEFESLLEPEVLWAAGVGVMLATRQSTIFRAQVAYGGEGFETILSVGRAF